LKILLIPCEKPNHPYADVRLVPIIPILKSRGNVVGLEFIHSASFETVRNFSLAKLRGYFSLAGYLVKSLYFGLRHMKTIDLIFCEHLYCAVIGVCLSILGNKPCIWDSHGNLTAASKEMEDPKIYTKILNYTEHLIRNHCKMLIVPTQLDKELYLSQGFSNERIRVIPCGVNLSDADRAIQDRHNIRKELGLDHSTPLLLFTGKRTYLPNKEAAWWINEVLAPSIKERFGKVKIIITGSGEIPKVIHESVEFVGFVQNIFKYIHAADICLVPVHLDNGISTKLLDFMACGKPSVVLSTVARGMPEIEDNKNVLLSDDLDGYIKRTIEALMMEKNQIDKIGLAAREVIERLYSWESIKNRWSALLDELISKG